MDVSLLPHVNAALNGTAAALLLAGFSAIRRDKVGWLRHRAIMLSAVAVSAAFLTSYLLYHFNAPIHPFRGSGAAKVFYYAVLITHVILAAVAAPMILVTVWRGLRGRFDRHRALARWTFGIWLYVSLTGIIVYLMLYRFNPPA